MHQHLELPGGRLLLVPHQDAGRQALAPQRHAIDEAELKRPGGLALLIQVTRAEAKVQLDAAISAIIRARALARALAQELPARDAREAVLRQARRGCVLRRRAKDGEDERDAAAHCFRAVEVRRLAQEELLVPRGILPADDGGAVEQDLDGFAGGQDGGDARVGVRDVHLCLRCEPGRDGVEGGRFLGTVDHVDDGGAVARGDRRHR
jgi:hypothetical protein